MLSDSMMLGGGRKVAYSVENSLLFRREQYLMRTSDVAGSQKKWTFSCWVRRGEFIECELFSSGASASRTIHLGFQGDYTFDFFETSGSASNFVYKLKTVPFFRDPTAWYHVHCAVDLEQQQVRLYVNGTQPSLVQNVAPAANSASIAASEETAYIGRNAYASEKYVKGSMAEVVFIDGQALPPSRFGEFDSVTGSWRPKQIGGMDFGTNGFYLGKSWDVANLGRDFSGKGNNWTQVGGFLASDVSADTPTSAYAVLNPLAPHAGTLDAGNLKWTNTANALSFVAGTVPVKTGKWYFEFTVDQPQDNNDSGYFGITSDIGSFDRVSAAFVGLSNQSASFGWGNKSGAGTATNVALVSGSYGKGDVFGFAVDVDAGAVVLSRKGTELISATGLNLAGKNWYPCLVNGAMYSRTPLIGTLNFGQRPFAYAQPAGFLPLCTANMPATSGQASGSFTGNANTDGPYIYTGAVPETLTVNGNAVTWGTHADKLATGFKLRTSGSTYNSTGTNTWVATYTGRLTVGRNHVPANAQINP